jgi:hypothetical protein
MAVRLDPAKRNIVIDRFGARPQQAGGAIDDPLRRDTSS